MVRWPEVVWRPFGRSQILVIHGIVVGLYYCSDRWKQPIYIIGLLEGRTPIPLCSEDNKHYVCLRCVELRMEHRHFIQQGIGNPLFSTQDFDVVTQLIALSLSSSFKLSQIITTGLSVFPLFPVAVVSERLSALSY